MAYGRDLFADVNAFDLVNVNGMEVFVIVAEMGFFNEAFGTENVTVELLAGKDDGSFLEADGTFVRFGGSEV